ncbi:MAG TPA: hypothetical protein VLD39_09640 [Gammaproteobacteria bacterium]|nr:hypothetical protein [Gammaproteobacteria bacterium]
MLKTLFITGILLGFAAVVGAAGFYPWVDHPRVVSRTQVLPNGGRREDFIVRLPVDHVASLGTEDFGLGSAAFPAALELPDELATVPLQLDHFKVRDAGGNVIGIASRHALVIGSSTAVAWSITVPSRGAIWLVGAMQPSQLEASFATIGYQPGESWTGELDVSLDGGPEGTSGRVAGGSDEFKALGGSYVERWHITGIGDTGELRGTIELNTTTYLQR